VDLSPVVDAMAHQDLEAGGARRAPATGLALADDCLSTIAPIAAAQPLSPGDDRRAALVSAETRIAPGTSEDSSYRRATALGRLRVRRLSPIAARSGDRGGPPPARGVRLHTPGATARSSLSSLAIRREDAELRCGPLLDPSPSLDNPLLDSRLDLALQAAVQWAQRRCLGSELAITTENRIGGGSVSVSRGE
jgi:hypothetical protein